MALSSGDLRSLLPQDRATPLMRAVEKGWPECVALLLEHGADVLAFDKVSICCLLMRSVCNMILSIINERSLC